MASQKPESFDLKKQRMALIAKALSHPARLDILEILSARKSCSCQELVESLPLSQSTVSQHLKELKTSGLISMATFKTSSVYSLNNKELKKVKKKFDKFLKPLSKKDKM